MNAQLLDLFTSFYQALVGKDRDALVELTTPDSLFGRVIALAEMDFLEAFWSKYGPARPFMVLDRGESWLILKAEAGFGCGVRFVKNDEQALKIADLFPLAALPENSDETTIPGADDYWSSIAPTRLLRKDLLADELVESLISILNRETFLDQLSALDEVLKFAAMLLKIGFRLNHFFDQRRYNWIFKGVELENQMSIFVKWLRPSREDMNSRFSMEIALLKKVSKDPGYPDLLRSGQFQGRYFHICRQVQGQVLRHFKSRIDPADWQRKLNLTQAMINLVTHLHDHGVVHRDVAPDHLVVDDQDRVTLLDFGMSASQSDLEPELWQLLLNNDCSNLGLVLCELWLGGAEFSYGDPSALLSEWGAREKLLTASELPENLKIMIQSLVLASHRFS